MTATGVGGRESNATDRPLDWGTTDQLNPIEAVMWRAESDPSLRSPITGVELLDCVPEWERFRAAHEWGSRLVPRFRKRVHDDGLTARWAVDEHFDLDLHLRRLRLPEGADLDAVLAEAARFTMTPFDRGRSPWEAMLLEGLPDGRGAYVLKVHHAFTDGIGAIQLFSQVHSRQREPRRNRPEPPPPEPASPGALERVIEQSASDVRALASLARGAARRALRPDRLLGDALNGLASARRVLGDAGVSGSPLLADRSPIRRFIVHEVAFADLRAAAKAANATLNDAFLAALLGGLRRYHDEFGVAVDGLPMAIPISVRREGDPEGGNRFAAARLNGPIAIRDPATRVRAVGSLIRSARAEPGLEALRYVTPLIARLPGPAIARIAGPMTKRTDLQASNVPGIRENVYLAGARIERLYPFAPLPGCAAMITLVTHGSTCCIGANLDVASFTDVGAYRRCLVEGFDEVLSLAH
jgi:diacylglycerol O-acyltransferase / wax synthase